MTEGRTAGSRRRWVSRFLLVALVPVGGCGGGGNGEAGEKLPPSLVRTEKVAPSAQEDNRRFSGYTHPWEALGVGFLVDGRVTDIKVREGDIVTKGQLLATLDPVDYALQEDLARIQVEALEPNFERVDGLVRQKALSEAQLDELRGKYKAALTQRKQAKRLVSHTRLQAPSDGVIMERKTSPGQVIGAGMPALIMLDLTRLKVKFGVVQKDLSLFAVDQEVDLAFPGIEGRRKGRVFHVSFVPDTKTRTFEMVIEVDNAGGHLRAGMLSHLHLTTGRVSGIFVPLLALKRDGDGHPVVYLVDEGTHRVRERRVETGRRFKDRIAIAAGLEGGEALIVEGQGFVNPGDEVRIR